MVKNQEVITRVNKTQFMIFSRKQNQIENIVVGIEGHVIQRVTQQSFCV